MQQFDLIESIPNSILSVEINGIGYSVTGISDAYLRFRCSKKNNQLLTDKFRLKKNLDICLKYLDYQKQRFESVELIGGKLESVSEASFWYEIIIGNFEDQKAYQTAFSFLTKQYSEYINDKLFAQDSSFSEKMCGYPASLDEELTDSYHDFFEEAFSKEDVNCLWIQAKREGLETAVFLDRFDGKKYLLVDSDNIRKNEIQNKLLQSDRFYIGNEYCFERCPALAEWPKLLHILENMGKKLTVALPPVSEDRIQIVKKLVQILKESDLPQTEILVNDFGMAELMTAEKIPVLAGSLLLKKRNDPRSRYRVMPASNDLTFEYKKGQAEQRAVKEILSGYGMKPEEVIWIPLHQTNTSSYCTLKAVMEEGERGRQKPVKFCEGYCERFYFAYPKHLSMIGIGNSLFTCDKNVRYFIEDMKKWKNNGVKRILWNGPV